jgi:hypothetical protein
MKSEKNLSDTYWLFKIAGVLVSCLLPIWTICEKFPIWKDGHGVGRSFGVGAILILVVVAIIFRKSVFQFLGDKVKLKHAPPIAVWLVTLIVSYVLIFIGDFMKDLTTVLWMGMIGCAIGTLLTFIGENFFGKKENKDE